MCIKFYFGNLKKRDSLRITAVALKEYMSAAHIEKWYERIKWIKLA
jgi:hypothetical protein